MLMDWGRGISKTKGFEGKCKTQQDFQRVGESNQNPWREGNKCFLEQLSTKNCPVLETAYSLVQEGLVANLLIP